MMASNTTVDWQEFIGFARLMAEAAGREILPHFRRQVAVDNKAGDDFDPVTEADRAAERAMRALIEKHYRSHGINGEEYGIKEGSSGYRWVLDPLDGTRAFLCGMLTWTTLIGLEYEGEPVLGFVHQPFVGESFYGSPGGAFHQYGERISAMAVAPAADLSKAICATTAPGLYTSVRRARVLAELARKTRLMRYDGDAYFYALLAAGRIDVALDVRLQPYDISPLIAIIRAAGGTVSDWGRDSAAGGGDVIAAASPALYDEVMDLIENSQE